MAADATRVATCRARDAVRPGRTARLRPDARRGRRRVAPTRRACLRRVRRNATAPARAVPAHGRPRKHSGDHAPGCRRRWRRRARAQRPQTRANASTHAMSASGAVRETTQYLASAPIAARSERLTPSARAPTRSPDASSGKCRPATSVSVVTARSNPDGTATSAASSPGPSTTPSPPALPPRIATMRPISSNSSLRFLRPQVARDAVEDAVDVLVAGLGAEGLGEPDVLVDRHLVRTSMRDRNS